MAGKVNPIPAGYHTVTPYLIVNDGHGALDFYKRAFGARDVVLMEGPPGKIAHAEFKIGDSTVMLVDERRGDRSPKTLGGTAVGIFLYVEDVDSVYNQAISAGAKADMPPQNMFWGDRYGKLTDPFGHSWALASRVEEVPFEELDQRMKDAMSQFQQQGAGQGS
ncbi:MAG: VOC family protein [Acidobacteriaceae bacterium]|nr:VOC family protein [Acidobacteriaceae bacterium]